MTSIGQPSLAGQSSRLSRSRIGEHRGAAPCPLGGHMSGAGLRPSACSPASIRAGVELAILIVTLFNKWIPRLRLSATKPVLRKLAYACAPPVDRCARGRKGADLQDTAPATPACGSRDKKAVSGPPPTTLLSGASRRQASPFGASRRPDATVCLACRPSVLAGSDSAVARTYTASGQQSSVRSRLCH
jgi:hypothetical protein